MSSHTPFHPGAAAAARPRNPLLTVAAGASGALVGGVAWMLVLGFTGWSVGVVASVVGVIVGWAMTQFLSSTAKWLPAVAALLSVGAILAANYLGGVMYLGRQVDLSFGDAWSLVREREEVRNALIKDVYGVMDLLFVGLAAYAAFALVNGAQENIRRAEQAAQASAAAAFTAAAGQPAPFGGAPAYGGLAAAPAGDQPPTPAPATGFVPPATPAPGFPPAAGPAPTFPPTYPPTPGHPSE